MPMSIEEAPIMCTACLTGFYDQLSFDLHECLKTEDESYICECGRSFSRQIDYRLHKRLQRECDEPHEGNNNDVDESKGIRIIPKSRELKKRRNLDFKPLPCGQCGKLFYNKINLTKHIVMHPGLPTTKCGLCGKVFPAREILQIHVFFHSETRSVTCNVCNKKFLDSAALAAHSKSHKKADVESVIVNYFNVDSLGDTGISKV